MPGQIRDLLLSQRVFEDIQANREPSIDRFYAQRLQVNLSREVSKIFKFFFIDKLFGVVDAAIQGNVDCED
jgi:hypothetical protein